MIDLCTAKNYTIWYLQPHQSYHFLGVVETEFEVIPFKQAVENP